MEKLEIINLALIELGQPITNSLSDTRNSVVVLTTIYNQVRDALQASYRWTFCSTRAVISLDDDNAPAFGWSSFYPFPEDFLRLISIEGNKFNYEVENNGILCDATSDINIKYLAKNTTEAKFHPTFIDAFVIALTIRANERITQNDSLFKKLAIKQLNTISIAKKVDAIQRPPVRQEPSELEGGFNV